MRGFRFSQENRAEVWPMDGYGVGSGSISKPGRIWTIAVCCAGGAHFSFFIGEEAFGSQHCG